MCRGHGVINSKVEYGRDVHFTLIFSGSQCWPHPKTPLIFIFWFFLCEEYKTRHSHSYVLIIFIYLKLQMMYSLHYTVKGTKRVLENVCVLSDMFLFVCVWTLISLLFSFSFRFVYALFMFGFFCLVWTRPYVNSKDKTAVFVHPYLVNGLSVTFFSFRISYISRHTC